MVLITNMVDDGIDNKLISRSAESDKEFCRLFLVGIIQTKPHIDPVIILHGLHPLST